MTDPQPIGWTVTLQDFTGYTRGTAAKKRLPKVIKQWFASRGEAEARKARERELHPSPDCLICVTPARFTPGRVKEKPKPAHKGGMNR